MSLMLMIEGQKMLESIKMLQDAIRQRDDRIKRLEEFVDQLTNPKFTRDDLHKEALLQRIKRLEQAGDAMDKTAEPFVLDTIDEDIPMSDVGEQYEITYDSPPTAGDHVAMDRARKQWRKAKEAKP